MRQIAPEQFAPLYSDPNAPSHKPPPPSPSPAPSPAAASPPRPTPPAPSPSSSPATQPTPAAAAPSRERPYGTCAPGARDFVVCLSGAADLADREVERTERAVAADLSDRDDVNPVMADSATRGLKAAGEAWRSLRERECGDLPLVEAGLSGSLYERRLICRIRRDVERVEALRAHYGG